MFCSDNHQSARNLPLLSRVSKQSTALARLSVSARVAFGSHRFEKEVYDDQLNPQESFA